MLIATLGGPTSNSYVELAEADALAVILPGGADWTAKADEERELSLIAATRWLDTLNYKGDRCAGTQRLKWPRSGSKAVCDGVQADCTMIPPVVKEAEVILAIAYVQSPSSFPGAGGGSNAPSGTFVKRQQLGELSIEYAQFNNTYGASCDDCDQPEILRAFNWINDLLGCWLDMGPSSGAGFVLTRECCDQQPLNTFGNHAANLIDPPPYNTMP